MAAIRAVGAAAVFSSLIEFRHGHRTTTAAAAASRTCDLVACVLQDGEPRRAPGRTSYIGAELRGAVRKSGGIGSGRRKRGLEKKDTMHGEVDTTLPFLEPHERTHKEEGHQVLVDVEYLLLRAANPFGLVLEIAEEANEYLRNNKEDSLKRKPVLKMISDRINEDVGEQVTDSYVDDQPDYEKYENM